MGICSSCLGLNRDRDLTSEVCLECFHQHGRPSLTLCLPGRELEIALRRHPRQSLWQFWRPRCWHNPSRSTRSPARDRGLAEGRSTNFEVRAITWLLGWIRITFPLNPCCKHDQEANEFITVTSSTYSLWYHKAYPLLPILSFLPRTHDYYGTRTFSRRCPRMTNRKHYHSLSKTHQISRMVGYRRKMGHTSQRATNP